MKLLHLLSFIFNLMRSFHAEFIMMRFPDFEDQFLEYKNPDGSNYNIDKDKFDEYLVHERSIICAPPVKTQLYSYHESLNGWSIENGLPFEINYQHLSINDVIRYPVEINKREEIGIKMKGIDSQLVFKRFLCSIYEDKQNGIHQELHLSSGPSNAVAFVLLRDGLKYPLKIYGLLYSNEVPYWDEESNDELVEDLARSAVPVCGLKKETKFELCSRIHYNFQVPDVQVRPYMKLIFRNELSWYDQGKETCHDRYLNTREGIRLVETLACVFNKQDVRDTTLFIAVKEMREKSFITTVMTPLVGCYDGVRKPLKVVGGYEVTLK